MSKLDQFLNLVNDGAWHSLNKLAKQIDIPRQKLATISKLLSEINLVEYEPQKRRVKIKSQWQKVLGTTEEELESERAATATVLLPPKKSINLQGIQVTNLTEKELEIGMRINKKLDELAIDTLE